MLQRQEGVGGDGALADGGRGGELKVLLLLHQLVEQRLLLLLWRQTGEGEEGEEPSGGKLVPCVSYRRGLRCQQLLQLMLLQEESLLLRQQAEPRGAEDTKTHL